jgi:hypothetical protein
MLSLVGRILLSLALIVRAIIDLLRLLGISPDQWLANEVLALSTSGAVTAVGWAIAGLCGLIGVVVWQWFDLGNRVAGLLPEARQAVRDTSQRIAIKNMLGLAVKEGQKIYASPNRQSAEAWVTDVRDLIRAAFGEGECALFLDDSGYIFYVSQNTTREKTWVEGRLRRLSALIARSAQSTSNSTRKSMV